MALFLCLNEDCTGLVSESNPLSTKHTNSGEPKTLGCYLFNDGLRTGVTNDTSGMKLIYTNIQIMVAGVSHISQDALAPNQSTTTVKLDSTSGWGIGTIIKASTERMRVEEILSSTSVRVTRNYNADGGTTSISAHTVGETFTPETSTVSLAPVSIDNKDTPSTFLTGGDTLKLFIDPTYLSTSITAAESATKVVSSNGTAYPKDTIIQIDDEQMKVIDASNNELTVQRGYNGTARASHQQRAIIYTVGLVDTNIAHKFFIKNDPPAGLPTQKKADIKIIISSNEEPL